MNPTKIAIKYPYLVIAILLLVVALGIIGFLKNRVELLTDTNPPQVLIITKQPGASAKDIEDRISHIIEKEMDTISGVENIRSTSRDQVSSIVVEFKYSKNANKALLDVQNAIARIKAELPEDARESSIYELTKSNSRPLLTLALTPKENSYKDLYDIRLLAENQIKNKILRLEGISDVYVFGGYEPEIRIRLSRDKLMAHNLSLQEVIAVLSNQNISAPAGIVYSKESEYLVRVDGEFNNLEDIKNLPLKRKEEGEILLSQVGKVSLAQNEPRSLYHGNNKKAIALGVTTSKNGPTSEAIKRIKSFLPKLKAEYSGINFDITQDQQPLIDINMKGMVRSIIQAVVLTILVIFFFLSDGRAALTAGLSIPLSFLFTLGVLWFTPFSLNMVTLTGLIVATGLVVDSSVVVLENIYRHFRNSTTRDIKKISIMGTRQIALANTAGTFTTIAVLLPIIFIGGSPQRTIGRLSFTISTTLLASLLISLTLIPLLTSRLLNSNKKKEFKFIQILSGFTNTFVNLIRNFYLLILRHALNWRVLTLIIAISFCVISFRIIPSLIGGTQMPSMDTGISIVKFNLPATDSLKKMEKTLNKVEDIIYQQEGVETVSSVVGSEAGALSFGTGGSISQSAKITVHLVDKNKREASIWEIQQKWRKKIRKVPGIKSYQISAFGATPNATTKAPLDIIVSGSDPKILDKLADQCLKKLKKVPGLVDIRRSWYFDEKEYDIKVNPTLARLYNTSPEKVSKEVKAAIHGIKATQMRLENYLNIPIRIEYKESDLNDITELEEIYVNSKFGPIQLKNVADINSHKKQPFITREDLTNTIDITGVNKGMSITQVVQKAKNLIKEIDVPGGYKVEFAGTIAEKKDTQKRLARSLIIGIIFLYLLLLSMFRSFIHPLTILSAVPLAVAGSLWGLLVFDKPMSMPGSMGMIFLAGIIINNSILILDFIIENRKEGWEKNEAIKKAIELRVRPILMTTFSTVVGLSPLAFEMAIGLERLSPLAIVAGSGLIIGTFFTMIVIPVIYSSFESLKYQIINRFRLY